MFGTWIVSKFLHVMAICLYWEREFTRLDIFPTLNKHKTIVRKKTFYMMLQHSIPLLGSRKVSKNCKGHSILCTRKQKTNIKKLCILKTSEKFQKCKYENFLRSFLRWLLLYLYITNLHYCWNNSFLHLYITNLHYCYNNSKAVVHTCSKQ